MRKPIHAVRRPGTSRERAQTSKTPATFAEVAGAERVATTLDVRPDLERGDEPFIRILEAAEATGENEILVIIAPFEPVPLYVALAARGFSHETFRVATDEWHVHFLRQPTP